jgi:hypothetical protein
MGTAEKTYPVKYTLPEIRSTDKYDYASLMKTFTRGKFFGNLFIPLGWTIFIQLLLCMPGTDIPGPQIEIPHFDKIVHVIFFGALVGLWCYYFSVRVTDPNRLKKIFFFVFLAACVNGIGIEFIQLHFVPMRSFDDGDIIADVLSAGMAYGICNVKLLSFK